MQPLATKALEFHCYPLLLRSTWIFLTAAWWAERTVKVAYSDPGEVNDCVSK